MAVILCAFPLFAGEQRPNILFILTDDQGYGDVSGNGNPVIKTPNIDKLREGSVRFSDFSVSSSCSPTRAALMSGMYNLKVGVTHTIGPREQMSLKLTILPQILKAAGYTTAMIGKWHLGGGAGYAPLDRGFDRCITTAGGAQGHFNPRIIRNGVAGKGVGFREDIYFNEAMKFMESCNGTPFFCYLATYSPHAPLAAPEEFIAPFKGKVDENTAKFFGMVANIDYNLGRLLKWMEEKRLSENTIIVFMNDNGGTYGVDTFNAGMRGCKCTAWYGGTRAMSYWRWPGRWLPHDVDALTAHIDVLPTLAAVANAKMPDATASELDGRSLLPFLEGNDDPWFADRMVFQHNGRWPSGMAAAHKDVMAGVRWKDYLLVRSRPCTDPDGLCAKDKRSQCPQLRNVEKGATAGTYTRNAQFIWGVTPGDGWALYDVRKDPGSRKNLAATHKDIVLRLKEAYSKWWDSIYPAMIINGGDRPLGESVGRPGNSVEQATKGEQ